MKTSETETETPPNVGGRPTHYQGGKNAPLFILMTTEGLAQLRKQAAAATRSLADYVEGLVRGDIKAATEPKITTKDKR